jgi:hypothetical protein
VQIKSSKYEGNMRKILVASKEHATSGDLNPETVLSQTVS